MGHGRLPLEPAAGLLGQQGPRPRYPFEADAAGLGVEAQGDGDVAVVEEGELVGLGHLAHGTIMTKGCDIVRGVAWPPVHRPRFAPLVLAVSVLFAACGSSSKAKGAGGDLPTVTGVAGAAPTIAMPKGSPPKQLVAKVVTEGSGPVVAKGDLLVANYIGQVWATGKTFDSSFSRGQPVGFSIGVGQVVAGWDEGLVGDKVGSRVLLVIPPDKGYGAGGQPDAGIKGTDTLVFVVDLVGTYGKTLTSAGADLPQTNADLPSVSAARTTKPVITVPPGKSAPAALSSSVLIEGTGDPVKAGQQILVQYVGVIWNTGKEFDSSWKRGDPATFVIGKGNLIPAWDESIPGVKVGSRVLLVVPPAKGYGPNGNAQAGIKGTDTLVFVLDIIAAY